MRPGSPYRFIATVLSLLLLAGAFVPATAQTPSATPVATPITSVTPTYEDAECMYEIPDDLKVGEDIFCGWVTAPMYPDGSKEGTVRLPVIRIAATTDSPTAEPLIILLGGPGQDMSTVIPIFSEETPMWRYLLERQDVILFDQRGMGKSEPSLACGIEAGMRDGSVESDLAIGIGLMRCANEYKRAELDTTAFTTTNNAADVEAIRIAMGYNQIDLYGISYGSKLALAVIRDYPESVRASIIASPLPMEANVLADQTIGFDAALTTLWAECAADAKCSAANPDPAGSLEKAVARLKENPTTVTASNYTTGEQMNVPINDIMFLQIVYLGVFVGPLAPVLPYLVTDVAKGDDEILSLVAPLLFMDLGITMGALYTYNCQDEVPFAPEAETKALIDEADVAAPLQSASWVTMGQQFYPLCSTWNLPASDPIENEPVVSDEPLLIITGTFDPITPASNGPKIQANFPNSQWVNFAAQGHDPASGGGTCAETIITDFLNDPSAPVEAACADTPIDFSNATDGPSATPMASPVAGN